MTVTEPMRIDVWSDLVCPWCYVGKARLEHALAEFAHRDQVEVTYHSFELDPHASEGEPVKVRDMLAAKYGMSPDQAEQAEERVAGLARAEGLPYSTDRWRSGSFDAHRLFHWAATHGKQQELLDRAYRAHFGRAEATDDHAVLAGLAEEVGLDRAEAEAILAGDAFADEVRADEAAAQRLGISGVPFYVLDQKYGLSGAQSPEVFAQALEQAWADHEAAHAP